MAAVERQDPGIDREIAFRYAFDYMKLHADQRQNAFRFYLIVIGALITALLATHELFRSWQIGLALILSSFLFWRLDERNRQLVKAAEKYLMVEEKRLATQLSEASICIMKDAEDRKCNSKLSWFATYTRVHQAIFLCVSVVGGFLISGSVVALICQ